jgi:hypothetical protein
MELKIYYAALVLHVIGITIMAGTTFLDFIAYRQFWKTPAPDSNRDFISANTLFKLQKIINIGMLLILLSGILMMYFMHQVWEQQLWFRIKMGILLLILLNGFALKRRMSSALKKLLTSGVSAESGIDKLSVLKRNITMSQLIQMVFVVLIFTLSVFKFN